MTTPQLRMDKSKTFSTVHGDRQPDDPHAGVHFYQNGIPFDARGIAMPDKIDRNDAKAVAAYDRKMKRLQESDGKNEPEPDEDIEAHAAVDEDDDDEDSDLDDVNLEAWLRGDTRYAWFAVSAAIRKRFSKQVTSIADAVVFLVNEGVLPAGAVADRFKSALK